MTPDEARAIRSKIEEARALLEREDVLDLRGLDRRFADVEWDLELLLEYAERRSRGQEIPATFPKGGTVPQSPTVRQAVFAMRGADWMEENPVPPTRTCAKRTRDGSECRSFALPWIESEAACWNHSSAQARLLNKQRSEEWQQRQDALFPNPRRDAA